MNSMSRRVCLADALFGESMGSSFSKPDIEPTLDDLKNDIRVHRASLKPPEHAIDCEAVVVDTNPLRVRVDDVTCAELEEETGESRPVWTFYRGAFVVDDENAPLNIELGIGDHVAPRVVKRDYGADKWTMDPVSIRLISAVLHYSVPVPSVPSVPS